MSTPDTTTPAIATAATEVADLANHPDLAHAVPIAGELVSQAPAVVQEAKAGYKTTEFWLSLITILSAQLGVLSLPGHYGTTITTVAAAVAYVLSRGLAKAGTPNIGV